jgi:hypothetical protein
MTTDQRKRTLVITEGVNALIFYIIAALPFAATFAAGAIAGISEILTFYPLGKIQKIGIVVDSTYSFA